MKTRGRRSYSSGDPERRGTACRSPSSRPTGASGGNSRACHRWYLDEDRLDHRHVGGNRDAIIEESGIIEAPVLVERPADALRDTALDLPLDIGGVARSPRPG